MTHNYSDLSRDITPVNDQIDGNTTPDGKAMTHLSMSRGVHLGPKIRPKILKHIKTRI